MGCPHIREIKRFHVSFLKDEWADVRRCVTTAWLPRDNSSLGGASRTSTMGERPQKSKMLLFSAGTLGDF